MGQLHDFGSEVSNMRIFVRGFCEDFNKDNYIEQLALPESKLKYRNSL